MSAILGEGIAPGLLGLGVAESQSRVGYWLLLATGIVLLGVFWGAVVAIAGVNALYLCISLIGCAFILLDFRVGVVLLIVLMPISRSTLFPHAMLGITGLNPLNLLLIATLGSYLLKALFDRGIRRFMPAPLFWLYLLPFLLAGALGSLHVGEIAPAFHIYGLLDFKDTAGYVRDLVVKPLTLVVFALLVAAAVERSAKLERFLVPTVLSMWVMSAMVVVFVYLSGVGLGSLASSESREFLSPLGMHANDLGRLYALAYALLLFTWAESRETGLRVVLLASMALVVVALILTFSRSAFFAFIVVNVIFVLSRSNAKTLIVACVFAAAALLVLPDAVYDRISTGFGGGLDAISAGRVEGIWLPLLPDVLRSPIYGNGLGSVLWSEAMRADTTRGVMQAHSAYLETLLDMGIAGLILVCAYFAHVWKGFHSLGADPAASPTLRGFFQGAAVGLVSFLLAGVAGSFLTPVVEQSFLWLAIGMMYGQRARRTRESSVSAKKSHAGFLAQPA